MVYRAMLGLLPLSVVHQDNLLARGLTDSAIRQNGVTIWAIFRHT